MKSPERLPGGLPAREFFRDHWQKKPLLIRNAFPDFRSPISPEELAGIALEEEAHARLIMERGGDYPWQVRYGPFEEDDFLGLPDSHWTLLVQEVDRWVPELAGLLERFLFVPSWRLDDVMVSYAPDGGNVGAHIDNYDVFLIQALGRREWRIGADPIADERLVPGVDVSMLADFEADEVMTLEEGDMLYLPPRIAHHGIAIGDCMTLSVGFRAPSYADILTQTLTRAIERMDSGERYADPDLSPPEHPGRIGEDALRKARRIVRHELSDEHIDRSFGALVTESTRGDDPVPPPIEWTPEGVAEALREGGRLQRFAPNRFGFIPHADGSTSLFAHGQVFWLEAGDADVASLLAGRDVLDAEAFADALDDAAVRSLLARLVNDGHVELLEEE